jgi:hypothetical protein
VSTLFVFSATGFAAEKTTINNIANDVPAAAAAPVAPALSLAQPDLLTRVRQANEELYSSLQSFVCNESMERFKGKVGGEESKHIDTVTTKVSFENGIEHYSDVYQNNKQKASIPSIAGAWSEGEFGTLLAQTQSLLNTQPVIFRMFTDFNGTPAAIYGFEVSEQDSPWDLNVQSHHHRIPFRTELWVSAETGQILKIERVSTSMPFRMGISEIRWSVTLAPVQMNGKTWLLPNSGEYAVLYEEVGRREWNELTFSNYHRYGSEVALRF